MNRNIKIKSNKNNRLQKIFSASEIKETLNRLSSNKIRKCNGIIDFVTKTIIKSLSR